MICDIEQHFGQRVKHQRQALKLTQMQLAKTLGLSSQQVHKYEKGVNRLAASQLLQLSQILCVPITFFYEGLKSNDQVFHKKEFLVTCTNVKGQQFSIKLVDPEQLITDIVII